MGILHRNNKGVAGILKTLEQLGEAPHTIKYLGDNVHDAYDGSSLNASS